jgi:cytochrome c-type biogenesis protein CcmE
MKTVQKLILPALVILIIFVIYTFYFAGSSGLGSFDDLDPNNNAVKEIKVHLLADRGVNQQGGETIFYVSDKNGKVVMVSGEINLPQGFDKADVIILKGHMSQGGFHTHEVLLD